MDLLSAPVVIAAMAKRVPRQAPAITSVTWCLLSVTLNYDDDGDGYDDENYDDGDDDDVDENDNDEDGNVDDDVKCSARPQLRMSP